VSAADDAGALEPFDPTELEQPDTGGDAYDLGLATSTLLAETTDIEMLLRVLAKQLAEAFGERLSVTRDGGRFRKSDKIRALDVDLGNDGFRAEVVKGSLVCTVAHSSGGIRIRSERVGMDQWLRRLLESLKAEAGSSQAARQALENMIIGGPA
jgi:hypothetical protein